MKTAAQVAKASQTTARDYYLQTDVVVMSKADFRALLEDTARQAFEAGQAAGPAKPKKEGRKRAVKPSDSDEAWWKGNV